MSAGDYLHIEPAGRRLQISLGGAIIVSTERALVLHEKGLPDRYYVPREDVRAETLYRRALAIREKVFGPAHGQVEKSLRNLSSLREIACAATAEDAPGLPSDGLASAEQQDPQASANALAEAARLHGEVERLLEQGELDAAIPLAQRAVAVIEKALGPQDLRVTRALTDLATLYAKKHEHFEAKPLYQRALSIQERARSPEHLDVAASLRNLAVTCVHTGDYTKAEQLYRRALSIYEKALGPDHGMVAATLDDLVVLYRLTGRDAEAEPLQRRAYALPGSNGSRPNMASARREQAAGASARMMADARRVSGEGEVVVRACAHHPREGARPGAPRVGPAAWRPRVAVPGRGGLREGGATPPS